MTQVMGIVNVTPDSFSDGGKYFRPEEAARRARNLLKEGADMIDFGAESTRPGATPVPWEEEWARLEPVLDLMSAGDRRRRALLSVDTYHPETAQRAMERGLDIINCVYAEPVPEMLSLLRGFRKAELVMPAGCWDLVAGDPELASRVYLDPMVGFGTTREEDLELIRSVPALAKKARVLVGASRKRIVKKLTGEKVTGKNLGGSIGIAVWCAAHGASVVRVHDVRETSQAIKVAAALAGGSRVVLCLGSNIEPRLEYLDRAQAALCALPATRFVAASDTEETEPVDVPPEFASQRFLNRILVVETALAPEEMSAAMHRIERGLGRHRSGVRNEPRTLDIDMIDYEGVTSDDPNLTLPHPRARERAFVMEPLRRLGISLAC